MTQPLHNFKSGELEKTIGQHAFPGLGEYQFCKPADVLIDDSSGDIYVADGYCNKRVARYTSEGKYIDSINGDFDDVHDISKGMIKYGNDMTQDDPSAEMTLFDLDFRTRQHHTDCRS